MDSPVSIASVRCVSYTEEYLTLARRGGVDGDRHCLNRIAPF